MSVTKSELNEWVRDVRGALGLSQSQLARLLGVSPRAVQSYEQGWRTLPQPTATQLMTVLALHRDHPDQYTPCWSLTGCPAEKRARCAADKVGRGRFCWLLSGQACGGPKVTGPLLCIDCVVIRNLLTGPCRRTLAGPEHSAKEAK